jgi:hypothetical protein
MNFIHNLRASLVVADKPGNPPRIVVKDKENNREVNVQYGATQDNCTCYAYVPGMGFIGGWQCMNKKSRMRFHNLVNYINNGVCYQDMNDLPTTRCYRRDTTVHQHIVRPPIGAYK